MSVYKKYKKGMGAKSITDLPNEVIDKTLMAYLSVNDLRSFARIGICLLYTSDAADE